MTFVRKISLVAAIVGSFPGLLFADCLSKYAALEQEESAEVNKRAGLEIAALVLVPYVQVAALAGMYLQDSPAEGRRLNHLYTYAKTKEKGRYFAIENFEFRLAKNHVYIPEDELVASLREDDESERVCRPQFLTYDQIVDRYSRTSHAKVTFEKLMNLVSTAVESAKTSSADEVKAELEARGRSLRDLEGWLERRRIYLGASRHASEPTQVVRGIFTLNRSDDTPVLIFNYGFFDMAAQLSESDLTAQVRKILIQSL